MRKPLVAVATDTTMIDGVRWHATQAQYVDAAAMVAGLTPLLVPNLGDGVDIEAILDAVDGVLLTGSKSNVDPALYGGTATEANGPYDRERDATSMPLLKRALERGIPLFAICRGMQELNVAAGGTLQTEIQDGPGVLDHRAPDLPDRAERFGLRQTVKLKTGSQIAGILGGDRAVVNSLHRQAIDAPGKRIVVDAMAEDGIAEAVSVSNAVDFALGVQWHPEFWAESDPASARLFAAFGDAVRSHAARRGI
jgi:putative glutamine amidotransferase